MKYALTTMIVALVLVFGLISFNQTALASEKPEAVAKSDPMQFARGAKSWANTCARCHNMRDPKSLRDDQWKAAMAHMRVRAGLTAGETKDILVFLQGSN